MTEDNGSKRVVLDYGIMPKTTLNLDGNQWERSALVWPREYPAIRRDSVIVNADGEGMPHTNMKIVFLGPLPL